MLTRVIILLAIAAALVAAAPPAMAADHGPAAAEGGHAGEGHGGGAAEALNPLESFKRDLAIWTGVIFLLLLFVLSKYAWGPIADGLAKRENRIHEDLAAAQRSNEEAKRLLEDYQRKLAATGDEVRQMIETGRREAERAGAEIVEKAKQAARAERDRSLAEIEQATQSAVKELADRSADLAVQLAGRIVGSTLDRTAHNRLIEQALTEFQKTPTGRRNGSGVG
jgi:F-type H+-transporting ATPase subunit b